TPSPRPLPLRGGEGARRAGEGAVHGPNVCEKTKRTLPMNQRNIQHRTPNAEHRMASPILAHFGVRCSMLDVRCFPSAQGSHRANVHFGEISPFSSKSEGLRPRLNLPKPKNAG